MKVERLEILHLRMPLTHPLETAFGPIRNHETLLVRAEAGGACGYGEVPAGVAPRTGHETVQTAWHVVRDFLAPRLTGREFGAPGPITDLFSAVSGHPMAKAGVEMAVLDLFGRLSSVPLWRILGGEKKDVAGGVDLGLEGGGELAARVEAAVGRGARRITVPIGPRKDVDVIDALRKRYPKFPFAADGQGSYRLSDADALRRLDAFELLMIEQPFSPEDLVDHAKLQAELKTPVSLAGSVRSYEAARQAVELGACRALNIHPARVGGPYAAKMIHNLARKRNLSAWCGGLVETGVGKAHALAVSSLPGFDLPGAFGDAGLAEDIVDPPFRMSTHGSVPVPPGAGIGYNVDERRLIRFCVRREHVLQ